MEAENILRNTQPDSIFLKLGFERIEKTNTGFVFLRQKDDTCIILDTVICDLQNHPYVSYKDQDCLKFHE